MIGKFERYWSLSEVSRIFSEPQHRLIYLCEKSIVTPPHQRGAGRGSSRQFSLQNLLEIAVVLKLRDLHIPSPVILFVLQFLRKFANELSGTKSSAEFLQSLAGKSAPEIRIIISDGQRLFCTMGTGGKSAQLFGGFDMKADPQRAKNRKAGIINFMPGKRLAAVDASGKFGPEASKFGRTEISLSAICRELWGNLEPDR